jgi:hypothetical protein
MAHLNTLITSANQNSTPDQAAQNPMFRMMKHSIQEQIPIVLTVQDQAKRPFHPLHRNKEDQALALTYPFPILLHPHSGTEELQPRL